MRNRALDNISVAAPCEADWGSMTGDEAVRFCSHCAENVYNISEMTEAEARTLISEREGKLCVRFYRRPDGSLVTRDCAPIWRTAGQRAHRAAAALFSALAAFSTMAWAQQAGQSSVLVQIQNTSTVLTGRVLDASGAPVPGAAVVFSRSKESSVGETKTDEKGIFRFPPMPAGTYSLEVTQSGSRKRASGIRFSGQPEERIETLLDVEFIGLVALSPSLTVESSPNPTTLHLSPEPQTRKKAKRTG